MGFLEMLGECLATVANFGAGPAFRTFGVAAPGFEVEMLRVLVAFPVVFATEGFGAGEEGAAVGPRVTLHVFSRSH
jgi:hypothetical protein